MDSQRSFFVGRVFCAALLASLAATALIATARAQQKSAAAPADPADPRAMVPPVDYRSALESYRPFREQPVEPWTDANETARKIGGHGGALKDDAPAAPATPAAPGTRP